MGERRQVAECEGWRGQEEAGEEGSFGRGRYDALRKNGIGSGGRGEGDAYNTKSMQGEKTEGETWV